MENAIVRTYKYPILINKSQELKFERWVRLCRSVYNLCIEQRERNWNGYQQYTYKEGAETPAGKSIKPTGKYSNWAEQGREITQLKKFFPEFAEVPSTVMDKIPMQVDQAYKAFYKNIKEGKIKGGVQKIKFSNRFEDFSLKYERSNGYELEAIGNRNARIYGFPKCKEGIKVRYYRPIDGKVLQQVIKKEGNRWFLCVTVQKEVKKAFCDGRPEVGVDLGVSKTVALSNNSDKMLPYDQMNKLNQRKKVLQRRLKRKKRGSSNQKKAYSRVAKIDERIANIRKYHLKMFASEIARDHSVIAVEKLNIKNMTKSAKGTVAEPGKNVKAKSGLNRVILNSSPYFFKSFLKQKAQEHGSIVIEVDPRYTSQMCFRCKNVDKASRQDQATYLCVKCAHTDNADYNAAKNILAKSKIA